MATLINNAGVQHYANQMLKAENRKVGSRSLPSALNEIDTLIDQMKAHFDAEYGSELDMKLENSENIFSVGAGSGVDKRDEVENSFTDIELKGNTLVNIVKSYNRDMFSLTNSSMDGNVFTLKYAQTVNDSAVRVRYGNHLYKANTKYSIIVDILENTSNQQLGISNIHSMIQHGYTRNFPNKTGRSIIVIDTTDGSAVNGGTPSYDLYFGVWNEGGDLSTHIKFKYMILEGDWSNKPLPYYFEGIKSVGESEGNKIEVLSRGKNLINIKDFKNFNSNGRNVIVEHKDNKIILTSDKTLGYTSVSIQMDTSKLRGKSVVIYHNGVSNTNNYSGRVLQFNVMTSDGAYKYLGSTANATVVNIPQDSETIHFCIYTNNSNVNDFSNTVEVNDLMICYADANQIPYEPYKEDKKQILLNEPLRGLPNGVKDSIEKVNEEWKIIRRCAEVLLNGNEAWVVHSSPIALENHIAFTTILLQDKRSKYYSLDVGDYYICDNLPTSSRNGGYHSLESEFVMMSSNSSANDRNAYIGIKILKSKLQSLSIDGFKNWLQSNPVKVIYELETPIVEDIPSITLQAWKNGTISIDSIIPVESTHTVALNKPAQIKRNIEELTKLRDRVEALEIQYDQIALEQAHQLELINNSISLDYDL